MPLGRRRGRVSLAFGRLTRTHKRTHSLWMWKSSRRISGGVVATNLEAWRYKSSEKTAEGTLEALRSLLAKLNST